MLTLTETAADSFHTSRACAAHPTNDGSGDKTAGLCIRFDACSAVPPSSTALMPELRDWKCAVLVQHSSGPFARASLAP